MIKLKINNFGPIIDGYQENDGYLTVSDLTLFIGDQGTGKSSIAKILSTCSWIEKALLRDNNVYNLEFIGKKEFDSTQIEEENYDLKHRLEYQNIHNYFLTDTYIEYIGDYYKIVYSDNKTSFTSLHCKIGNVAFVVPQIMYVPAERNFISVVEGASGMKNLPSPLYTFLDEYDAANKALKGSKQRLPLGNFDYQYSTSIKQGVISGIAGISRKYEVKLSEASSGLQSATPLFIVSDYLAALIKGVHETLSKKRLSLDNEQSRDIMIDLVRDAGADFAEESIEIQNIESRFENRRFLNIVEEMEQNLFPKSQQSILYDLIRCVNSTSGNSLVLTTHSPYVINYISLAIKANEIKTRIVASSKNELLKELNLIVPEKSTISGDRVAIYELESNGTIKKLGTWGNNMPSDDNFLNESLREANDLYNDLLELEEKI